MRRSLSILLMCLMAHPALSAEMIKRSIPNAEVVGEGRLVYAFWDIYDATLYAPNGKISETEPFALSIRYMRSITADDLADRSVQEMRDQGFSDEIRLAAWNAQMKRIFPNVHEGTVLTAVFFPGKETRFYRDHQDIGVITDAGFTQWFSSIWLGEGTSHPMLRLQLLGLS